MAGSGGYLRNLVAQTGARLVFLFTTLGVFIAIARSMGPEAFGQYSYAVTFATLFATLADFGTGAILGRELTARRGQVSALGAQTAKRNAQAAKRSAQAATRRAQHTRRTEEAIARDCQITSRST